MKNNFSGTYMAENETATTEAANKFGNIYLFVFWVIFLAGYVTCNVLVLALAIFFSQDKDDKKKRTGKILYVVALFMLVIIVGVLAAISAWTATTSEK